MLLGEAAEPREEVTTTDLAPRTLSLVRTASAAATQGQALRRL